MAEVAGTPTGSAEYLSGDHQAAADSAQATEVSGDGLWLQVELTAERVQRRQLAVAGDA